MSATENVQKIASVSDPLELILKFDNPWVQYFGVPKEHKVTTKLPIDLNLRKTQIPVEKSEHIMSTTWYPDLKSFGASWWAFFTNKHNKIQDYAFFVDNVGGQVFPDFARLADRSPGAARYIPIGDAYDYFCLTEGLQNALYLHQFIRATAGRAAKMINADGELIECEYNEYYFNASKMLAQVEKTFKMPKPHTLSFTVTDTN